MYTGILVLIVVLVRFKRCMYTGILVLIVVVVRFKWCMYTCISGVNSSSSKVLVVLYAWTSEKIILKCYSRIFSSFRLIFYLYNLNKNTFKFPFKPSCFDFVWYIELTGVSIVPVGGHCWGRGGWNPKNPIVSFKVLKSPNWFQLFVYYKITLKSIGKIKGEWKKMFKKKNGTRTI